MHTEHIRNLHPGWVVGGWLVAVAVTSVAFMVFVGLNLIGPGTPTTGLLVPVAIVIGFFVGGLFVGMRWSDAPILHGSAITLVSIVVLFGANVLFPGPARGSDLGLDAPGVLLGMILLQLVAAVAGGWAGRRMVRGGEVPAGE